MVGMITCVCVCLCLSHEIIIRLKALAVTAIHHRVALNQSVNSIYIVGLMGSVLNYRYIVDESASYTISVTKSVLWCQENHTSVSPNH